jgi:hypothetical protein
MAPKALVWASGSPLTVPHSRIWSSWSGGWGASRCAAAAGSRSTPAAAPEVAGSRHSISASATNPATRPHPAAESAHQRVADPTGHPHDLERVAERIRDVSERRWRGRGAKDMRGRGWQR